MPTKSFSKGDSVIHAAKPEWGPGDVVSAEGQMHEGKPCQRLTIRFARAGLKTISTAFADLRPASEAPLAMFAKRFEAAPEDTPSTSTNAVPHASSPQSPNTMPAPFASNSSSRSSSSSEGGPSMQDMLERAASLAALQKLPEQVNDPFVPIMKRVQATMALYNLWDKPAGVLDWATIQTGLRDPMSMMSRHELEAQMDRFRIALDGHLRKLLRDARKEDAKSLDATLAQCGPAAKAALRRVDIGR